jgi:hypothetical protein
MRKHNIFNALRHTEAHWKCLEKNGHCFVLLANLKFSFGLTRGRKSPADVKEHSMYLKSQFHALELMCR